MVMALFLLDAVMENPELVLFRNTAKRMQPMLDELVFTGGCAISLLFSEPGFIRANPPQWLDVIANTNGELGHTGLTIKLKDMGMREDTMIGRGRWKMGALTVCFWNVDPVFSPFATPEMKVKIVNPAFLIALKIEAFQGRGQANYQSDDLNDIVSLIAARPELPFDLKLAPPTVRGFVQKNLAELKPKHEFQEAVKRILGGEEALVEKALQRLNELVRIDLK
jgi:hypothetical protein